MNFLAHFILSQRNKEIIVGNYITDFVKSNKFNELDVAIMKGVMVHKEIDTFSDQHIKVSETRELLYPHFGHYARVIVDMYYDHVLTQYWDKFSVYTIQEDILYLYQTLEEYQLSYPLYIQRIIKKIIALQWMEKYQSLIGLQHVFRSMSIRVKFDNKFEKAIPIYLKYENEIHAHFLDFFESLKIHIDNFINCNSHLSSV
jgi:acyl carrier protein phosphodiesterase